MKALTTVSLFVYSFDVPAGPYQLEVYSPEFHFTPVRMNKLSSTKRTTTNGLCF